MNTVVMIGRLVADPDTRVTSSGASLTNFRIAVDRPYVSSSGEREADFFPVVCWNKLAEICANNLTKGRLVGVHGRLQTRSYETEDGSRRYVTEIVADTVQFLDSKRPSADEASAPEEEKLDFPIDEVPF